MKLSIVIPAYNEEGSIKSSVLEIHSTLVKNNVSHEILVINDNSKDHTEDILKNLMLEVNSLRYITNPGANGFGYAVRLGLENFSGDCVAIMMGDMSDSPDDLVKFYFKMQEGYDCVFGSRFMKGGKIYDYPFIKLIINRIANRSEEHTSELQSQSNLVCRLLLEKKKKKKQKIIKKQII